MQAPYIDGPKNDHVGLSQYITPTGAKWVLVAVGLEYLALGIAGLVALLTQATDLLTKCFTAAMFFLVAPMPILLGLGAGVTCLESKSGCHADNGAQAAIAGICVISIVGGSLAIWGALSKTKIGKRIWLSLICVSILAALSNLSLAFSFHANALIALASFFWPLVYGAAYYFAFGWRDR